MARKRSTTAPPLPAETDAGLVCPRCECRHFYVDSTVRGDRWIKRYRSCRNCGRRVVTTEKIGIPTR